MNNASIHTVVQVSPWFIVSKSSHCSTLVALISIFNRDYKCSSFSTSSKHLLLCVLCTLPFWQGCSGISVWFWLFPWWLVMLNIFFLCLLIVCIFLFWELCIMALGHFSNGLLFILSLLCCCYKPSPYRWFTKCFFSPILLETTGLLTVSFDFQRFLNLI